MDDKAKVTKYFFQILDKMAVHIMWTLVLMLATSIFTYFFGREFEFTVLEIGLMIILVVLSVSIMSYLVYRKINRRIPSFTPVDCNFHIIKEERVHRWVSENEYIHKRRYTIKALTNGLTSFPDKFQWTGNKYELSCGKGEYKIEQTGSKNIFELYNFVFLNPLKKGEIIELEAIWHAEGPSKPFFSTTIEEPTDSLIMSVRLFPESKITHVNCEISSYKGAQVSYKNEKQKLDSDGEFVWKTTNPKLLYHYEINWKTI